MLIHAMTAAAQEDIVRKINEGGKFDKWCVREIKESAIIGGQTEYLYEFYGNQDTLVTGKKPFKAPEGYLWRTNNVLAVVAGVVKTNNTVYPEKRGDGYCARIETHIEEVKALGIVNMDVTCQGVILIGELPEPITTTKDPMAKVFYGIPFTGRPKALRMDIKADVGHEVIRGTGFSKLKPMGYLIEKDMKKTDMRIKAGISTGALAKLGKNENVNTEILAKICKVLECGVDDVMEFIPEDKE